MPKAEWFRRSTWTAKDAAEFESRLRRSRSVFHKAQYLRIQAWHLKEAGTPELTPVALSLLDRVIAQFPDPSQLAATYMQRAECLVDLGHPSEALEAYRDSLRAQRRNPQWRDHAYLGFGELVLSLGRSDLYHDALTALDEFGSDEVFPAEQYRSAAIRALIEDDRGHSEEASAWARRALEAAGKTESPFRRHRALGLVRFTDPDLHERLKRLAT